LRPKIKYDGGASPNPANPSANTIDQARLITIHKPGSREASYHGASELVDAVALGSSYWSMIVTAATGSSAA
jgi:hypothetical protein